jgi:hypothetical protein
MGEGVWLDGAKILLLDGRYCILNHIFIHKYASWGVVGYYCKGALWNIGIGVKDLHPVTMHLCAICVDLGLEGHGQIT